MRGTLSEKARKNKVAYNIKRNKRLYTKFSANLFKEEYNCLCDFLNQIGMNKAEFIRWAYDKIREEY